METGTIFEHNGRKFIFATEYDETHGAPWDNGDDGHGEVRALQVDCRSVPENKRAGEVLIYSTGFTGYFYDMAAAVRKARAEDWSYGGKSKAEWIATGLTAKQVAANAAKADYDWFKSWANDDWHYVGAVVTLCDDDGKTPRALFRESLWGIESDSGDYFDEVARELADEICARLA